MDAGVRQCWRTPSSWRRSPKDNLEGTGCVHMSAGQEWTCQSGDIQTKQHQAHYATSTGLPHDEHCLLYIIKIWQRLMVSPSAVPGIGRAHFDWNATGGRTRMMMTGPFLVDVPGLHVPSDRVFLSHPVSSSSALPIHLHFDNCSDVFCFIASFQMPEPFQLYPSRECHYWLHPCCDVPVEAHTYCSSRHASPSLLLPYDLHVSLTLA